MGESPEVLAFRVSELDKNMRELRGEFKEAVGQLGGGLTALQTQLASYQSNSADRFVPRRDYESRQREIDDRFKELSITKNNDSSRMWLAISALGTVASTIAAFIGWFRPLH